MAKDTKKTSKKESQVEPSELFNPDGDDDVSSRTIIK